jgi:hypothetical protein
MKGGLGAVTEYLLLYIYSVSNLVQPKKKHHSLVCTTYPEGSRFKSAFLHNNKQAKIAKNTLP